MFDYRRTQMARHDVSAPLKALVKSSNFHMDLDYAKTLLHFGEGRALEDTFYLGRLIYPHGKVTAYDPYSDSPARRDMRLLDQHYDMGIAIYVFNVLPPDQRYPVWVEYTNICDRAYFALRTDKIAGEPYKDGVITKHNTFQKSYTVEEAQDEFPDAYLIHSGNGFIWMVA